MPNNWRQAFQEAVINAYTRWMNVAGVDLRFQFYGYTNQTQSNDGELVISMNRLHHPNESRLASTFGSTNRLIIVFHRRNGDGTPWNFVPYNAQPGELDMQGVLMHELGHCLGLDHTGDANETMFASYGYQRARFGPFRGDVARLRALYPSYTQNRLRQLRSTDGGASWTTVNNELTSHGHVHTRTNQTPGVVRMPGSGLYLVGWSHVNDIPTWLRGDGENFIFRNWFYYGGERSVYGPAYADDDDRTMLWAWVNNDDQRTIKVVRSTNHGLGWTLATSPAGAQTYGTPALCWTRVNGQSTWILAWAHFDRSNHNTSGTIRASVSSDAGWSWSAAVDVGGFYRALGGISAAATPNNHIEIAFAWAPTGSSLGLYGMNRIRTFVCQVQGGQLQRVNIVYPNVHTRVQPTMAYDVPRNRMVMAWREQNFNTSVNAASRTPDSLSWSPLVRPGPSSHTAPALAASSELAEVVMWYVNE